MKQLLVLLAFLFAIALVIGSQFLIHHLANTNPNTPPTEQIAESADAPPEGERSGKWTTVRKQFLELNPVCEACGSDEELNVHHVRPFHDWPELELDASNLITLCREHHFTVGHDPDGPWEPKKPNWKLSNPNVWRHAKMYRDSLGLAP